MPVKFSIIVTTYGARCDDLLKPCLNSIKEFTDLDNCEVIIVANGCTDNTREFVESLGDPFKLIWHDNALGYTKACNIGIRQSVGEYVILLNNDTVVLRQTKNTWLNYLEEPFKRHASIAVTGPMMAWCPSAQSNFLIGFCTMFKKEILNKIGIYDEIFEAYGEDCDICLRAEANGYNISAVPGSGLDRISEALMIGTGEFPIYHKGNESYKNWVGGDELLRKNNQILKERYNPKNITIDRAMKCDGYMNTHELKWLAEHARDHKILFEIGSWHGKSSRAIADNLSDGGVLYCIDTWAGSVAEPQNHGSAKWMDGDHAYYEFLQNNFDLIQDGKIIPLRMTSHNAANFFKEKNIKADFIFIDADHTYEGCKRDIDDWKDIIKDDGLFCGHDYSGWCGVNQAVEEKIAKFKVDPHCTIWYCGKNDIKPDKPVVYDTIIFNNELDILEIRLNELYSVVDRFVIVEGNKTHSNKPKELSFNSNLKRFDKFLHKITYIVVEDWPATDSWSMERHQRDQIMRGLTSCKENDIIIMGDCDEIPRAESIKDFDPSKVIMNFEQNLYYYSLNCQADQKWDWLKITTYKNLKEKTPCGVRYTPFTAKDSTIKNGGWHFSYCTDISGIIYKIDCTAHQEYNRDDIKEVSRLEKLVKEGKDVFGRDLTYHFTTIDDTYPKYVLDNPDKHKHLMSS